MNHAGHVPSVLKESGLTKDQPVGKPTRNLSAKPPVTTVAETVMGAEFVPLTPIADDDVAVGPESVAACAEADTPSAATLTSMVTTTARVIEEKFILPDF